MMRQISMLFKPAMVRALLKGRKTQTRRSFKFPDWTYGMDCTGQLVQYEHQEGNEQHGLEFVTKGRTLWNKDSNPTGVSGAYLRVLFMPGDRIWVRENCWAEELMNGKDGVFYPADRSWHKIENTPAAADAWHMMLCYARKGDTSLTNIGKQVPCIHMPRWASRLTLAVTDVRVQRLNEISEADAIEEGIMKFGDGLFGYHEHAEIRFKTAKEAFKELWNNINCPDAWAANPWVKVIKFDVIQGNIGEID